MKALTIFTLSVLCSILAVGADVVPKTVTADSTTYVLAWPSNFFSANSNALNAAVGGNFGGVVPITSGGTGATNASGARVAFGFDAGAPGSIGTNLLTTVTAADARTLLGISGVADLAVVADIDELEDYSGTCTLIVVEDANRGGLFAYTTNALTADGGVVFSATGVGSGFWKRQFDGPYNVRWFGAVGDGVTDDTAAFNSAIATYTGYVGADSRTYGCDHQIFVPKGDYLITDTLLINYGCDIRGETAQRSRLLFNAENKDGIVIENLLAGGHLPTYKLADLGIYKIDTTNTTSGSGLRFYRGGKISPRYIGGTNTYGTASAYCVDIRRVNINKTGTGVGWYHCFDVGTTYLGIQSGLIDNVFANAPIAHGFYSRPGTTMNAVDFRSCYASYCGGNGFRISAGSYCTLTACANDSPTDTGYHIDAPGQVTLVSCGAEKVGGTGYALFLEGYYKSIIGGTYYNDPNYGSVVGIGKTNLFSVFDGVKLATVGSTPAIPAYYMVVVDPGLTYGYPQFRNSYWERNKWKGFADLMGRVVNNTDLWYGEYPNVYYGYNPQWAGSTHTNKHSLAMTMIHPSVDPSAAWSSTAGYSGLAVVPDTFVTTTGPSTVSALQVSPYWSVSTNTIAEHTAAMYIAPGQVRTFSPYGGYISNTAQIAVSANTAANMTTKALIALAGTRNTNFNPMSLRTGQDWAIHSRSERASYWQGPHIFNANSTTVAPTLPAGVNEVALYQLYDGSSKAQLYTVNSDSEITKLSGRPLITVYTNTVGTASHTLQSWCNSFTVICIGGGGGGGSGRVGAAGTAAYGGGGGGGGGFLTQTFARGQFATNTFQVVVGAGGTGGAAQTTDSTDGANGNPATASFFGDVMYAISGGRGFAGTASTGAGASYNSLGGSSSISATANIGTSTGWQYWFNTASGGGGGGGIDTSNTHRAGGAGGVSYYTTTSIAGGTGGAAGGTAGSAASDRVVLTTGYWPGAGGGGGGANAAGSGVAGDGGNGGWPGGGGGGGGAARDGGDSGKGGDGGNGLVVVIENP